MKNYGYRPEPIVAEKDYQFGGFGNLGGSVLQPDGQWLSYLPEGESQLNFGFDPQGCVSWGTENAVEILLRRVYGEVENFSDRFLAKVSLTTPSGNSPQQVAEALRKQGVPRETLWPIDDTCLSWETFYAAIPQSILTLALEFVAKYDFKHEYVGTTPALLKEALKYSPLGISVSAWVKQGETGYYISTFPNNHWCVLVGYEDGKYWLAYDSYPDSDGVYLKKLAWDHQFSTAKRYAVTVLSDTKSQGWWDFLVSLIQVAFGLPTPTPALPPVVTVPVTIPPASPKVEADKLLWATPEQARHSVRVICDQEGLTVEQKNTMCATIGGESGWRIGAINYNRKNGKLLSTDYGICQWNDHYHGHEISPDEALNNPEKAVRLMCAYWKRGQRNLWIAYKSGSYKKYL